MTSWFSCGGIGDSELCASVAPKDFGWAEENKPVWPSSLEWNHLSPQLTRLERSHKDLQGIYWMICNELDAENAEQIERKLDEVFFCFFERGNKYAWDKCKNTQENTRELHLEMVGDKVTYVRVYWLRSQVRSLDHRSYSLFKLKMGLPFFV